MTTHVASWIGPGLGYHKLGNIFGWLENNGWKQANSMTDLVWSKANYFSRFTQNETDPRYDTELNCYPDSVNSGFYIHLFFKSLDDAILFKLTWGGR